MKAQSGLRNILAGFSLLVLGLFLISCGVVEAPPDSTPPAAHETSVAPQATSIPTWLALEQIDSLLQDTFSGNLAYNAPQEMRRDETRNIQLLISPVLTSDELEQLITETDPVVSAAVSLTPRMKAELRSASPGSFDILALHDNPEQLLTNVEPTEWNWAVTAREEGQHSLVLTVYRLVEYDNQEYWRQLSYTNNIEVRVTLGQRLMAFDWYWLGGIVLAGLLIPAIWRWLDRLKKSRPDQADKDA